MESMLVVKTRSRVPTTNRYRIWPASYNLPQIADPASNKKGGISPLPRVLTLKRSNPCYSTIRVLRDHDSPVVVFKHAKRVDVFETEIPISKIIGGLTS